MKFDKESTMKVARGATCCAS